MGLRCRVSVSARSRGLPWRAPAARMELRREQLLAARRLVYSFARSRAQHPGLPQRAFARPGLCPNKLKVSARRTDPGDERAHGARLTRGSAASNDRTGTSLSSCSDLPLPPMAIKSSLLPV